MGAARITLIVFSMASILVLAGFSIILNEKAYGGFEPNNANGPIAPPFGDFECWEILEGSATPVPPALLAITDQFGTIENSDWEQIEYCTAAEKNGEPSPFSNVGLAQHYQGWLYPFQTTGFGTGQTVIIDVPQFQQNFQTTLGDLDSILVPATKTLPSEEIVESFDTEQHWNCYLITGPDPNVDPVNLLTQHGDEDAEVLDPVLFCAPMIKFDPSLEQSFGQLFDEHMICYDIFVSTPLFPTLPVKLFDQLTPSPIDIALGDERHLCVTATKSFPTVGGSMIPIDTTALLLAGVQSISMWMIPVVIAGVGVGVFVVLRRK